MTINQVTRDNRRMKINGSEIVNLRQAGWKQSDLATRYGCSKAAVSHYLHRQRSRINKASVPVPCACGCGVNVTRQQRKFASVACYYRTVCRTEFISCRQGQRQARKIASGLFALEPAHVVHHVDGNEANNELSNLWVFASHADHMSHHRGGPGAPIWRGL